MDLFASDSAAIADGNRRSSQQDAVRAGVQARNNELSGNIAKLKQGVESQSTETAIQGAIGGYMAGNGFKNGIQSYKAYRDTGLNKVNELNKIKNSPTGVNGDVRVGDTAVTVEPRTDPSTGEPLSSPAPEGPSATGNNPAPTAVEHEAVTVGEDGQGKAGSMVHDGMKSITGLSDGVIDKVGKGVGVLGSAAVGGMDLYKDISGGKIAGNNFGEKAGNVLQIGGSIADTLGVVFPPAAIIGGALDVVGAISNEIGEIFDGKSKSKALDAGKAAAQKAQVAATPAVLGSATIVGARTE